MWLVLCAFVIPSVFCALLGLYLCIYHTHMASGRVRTFAIRHKATNAFTSTGTDELFFANRPNCSPLMPTSPAVALPQQQLAASIAHFTPSGVFGKCNLADGFWRSPKF
ncbi:hypothetical protein GPALN_011543 [Globodera pallida]|nr:hypothetical protein GPALN_011543 [Globodera pallida]